MDWTKWLPLTGDRTVRQRVRELEQEAGSLPVVFAVLMGKVIEYLVLFRPKRVGQFSLAALLVLVVYVYSHTFEDVKESASEAVEETVSSEG